LQRFTIVGAVVEASCFISSSFEADRVYVTVAVRHPG